MKLFELQDRPEQEKNFPRDIMPQIRKGNLQDSPFTFEKGNIKIKKLKPVQNQRVKGMHDRAKQGFADGSIRPIVIDKNNYIVNGHHRYDVARGLDYKKVKVLKVNATIEELIEYFSDTSSSEPTYEEFMKQKLDSLMETIEAAQDINALMKGIDADLKQRKKDLKKLPKKSIYSEGDLIQGNFPKNSSPTDNIIVYTFTSNLGSVRDWVSTKQGYIKDKYHLSKYIKGELDKGIKPEHIKVQVNGTYIRMPEFGITENKNVIHRNFGRDQSIEKQINPGEPQKAFDAYDGDYLPFYFSNGMELNLMDDEYSMGEHSVWVLNDKNGEEMQRGEKQSDLISTLQDMTQTPLVTENFAVGSLTAQQMLAKLAKEMKGTHTGASDPNSDWSKYVLSHKKFTLKDVQVAKIPTSVKNDGMNQTNIEKYKKADTSQFPPVVIGNNGYLLDGNHRLSAYKHQGIKTIKAYVGENFKDGKVKGKSRPGRVKKAGASCKGSVTSLRKKAKNSSGEKAKMYHWCANMKAGRKKS